MLSKKLPSYLNFKSLFLLAILIGSSLRLTVYLQNRSFMMDEANLARNIVERNFTGFFEQLDYEQYSPPLFSCALKTLTQIFGVNEYSLTLLSLLAGIGCLIMLFLFARKLEIGDVSILYLLLLFSFSSLAIRYSSELKQYSLDAFLCLLFVYWAWRKDKEEFGWSYVLQLMVFGSLAIWLSMPIIFVLATIGFQLLWRCVKRKDVNFGFLVLIGGVWLLSFGVYFFSILQADAGSDYLQNFHKGYFFDLLPTDKASLNRNFNLLLGLFTSVTDKTVISLIGGFLFFALGLYQLVKTKKTIAFLLLLPILLCIVASHFQMYSLLERLTLFMIPMMCLVFAFGFSWAWSKSHKYLKVLLCAFMILTLVNKKGYEHFWNPLEVEDAKSAMQYLKENRKARELIMVHHAGVPAFVFYNEMHDNAFGFDNAVNCRWQDGIVKTYRNDKALLNESSFWVFYSHTEPVSKLKKDFDELNEFAKKLEEHTAVQSIVQKYQRN